MQLQDLVIRKMFNISRGDASNLIEMPRHGW